MHGRERCQFAAVNGRFRAALAKTLPTHSVIRWHGRDKRTYSVVRACVAAVADVSYVRKQLLFRFIVLYSHLFRRDGQRTIAKANNNAYNITKIIQKPDI